MKAQIVSGRYKKCDIDVYIPIAPSTQYIGFLSVLKNLRHNNKALNMNAFLSFVFFNCLPNVLSIVLIVVFTARNIFAFLPSRSSGSNVGVFDDEDEDDDDDVDAFEDDEGERLIDANRGSYSLFKILGSYIVPFL